MANCSIPSWIPATGRILTTSSRRSRKLSKRTRVRFFFVRRWEFKSDVKFSTANPSCGGPPYSKARFVREKIRRWMLDVERPLAIYRSWAFSSSGRVKGAWWPSRSSKPSSPRKWRGRFDSYPLRFFPAATVAVSLCETRASPTGRRLQPPCNERR